MAEGVPCPSCETVLPANGRKFRTCPSCRAPIYLLDSHGIFPHSYVTAEQREVVLLANRIDGYVPAMIDPTDPTSLDRLGRGADPWPALRSAADEGRDLMQALRHFYDHVEVTIPECLLPSWYFQAASLPWNDPLETRQKGKRIELRRELASGVMRCAQIVTQGPTACDICGPWDGVFMDIEQALALMPLPHPDCTYVPTAPGVHLAFPCRCGYIFTDEATFERGRRVTTRELEGLRRRNDAVSISDG